VLIKRADDKQPQLDALEALRARPDISSTQRRAIDDEIRAVSAGWRGEREAAYEIEFVLGESKNFATIHDLRLEHNGNVAQIDHLVVNRLMEIWVCESKAFAEGVSINSHGEWSRYYRGRPVGMPSPVEQNRRHMLILERLFDAGAVPLPKRLGAIAIKPDLKPVVLVSNAARISRPRAKVDGIETVIKVEALRSMIERNFDDRVLRLLTRAVGRQEIDRFARDLAALHRPASFDWQARFGLQPAPALVTGGDAMSPRAKVCASCGGPVTGSEAFYSRLKKNQERFGGKLYCRSCQAKFPSPTASH
jgi:hypothetical protein